MKWKMAVSLTLCAILAVKMAIAADSTLSPSTLPSAHVIGIHFAGTGHAPDWGTSGLDGSLAADITAGVISQAHWNNAPVDAATGDLSALTDATGAATAATVNWDGGATYDCGGSLDKATGDQQLLYSYLDTTDDKTTITIKIDKLPYAKYKVFTYVSSGNADRVGHVSINGGAGVYYKTIIGNPATFNGKHVKATATKVDDAASADYVEFDDVTGATVTVTNVRDGDDGTDVGINGIQIVAE
jgi:hypothetical protein